MESFFWRQRRGGVCGCHGLDSSTNKYELGWQQSINTTANAFFTPHCPLEHVMGWGNNRCQCHGSTGNGQWCGAALGRLMPFDGCFVLLQRMVVVEQECVL
eukprot:168737_1